MSGYWSWFLAWRGIETLLGQILIGVLRIPERSWLGRDGAVLPVLCELCREDDELGATQPLRWYPGGEVNPGRVEVRVGESLIDFCAEADESEIEFGAQLGFEVSVVEALQKHEGDEQGEHEVDDGGGMVFEAVVEGEVGDQDVEQRVLDVPSAMSGKPKVRCGQKRGWDGGNP